MYSGSAGPWVHILLPDHPADPVGVTWLEQTLNQIIAGKVQMLMCRRLGRSAQEARALTRTTCTFIMVIC